jgi:DNA invertase Pin-like site-specific DNA recombinase
VSKRGAGFRSLKDTWADTTSPHGRLMLTVLGGLAEFERELIRARTGEGRKRGKSAVSGSAGRESSPRTNARKPYSVLRQARRSPTSPGATRWTPPRSGGCLRRLG